MENEETDENEDSRDEIDWVKPWKLVLSSLVLMPWGASHRLGET